MIVEWPARAQRYGKGGICNNDCRLHIVCNTGVDPGDRIRNRTPKEKQCQIVPQRNAISLEFAHALGLYLCSYMPNFSSGEEATDEKMRIIFLVCQDYNNWVVREGRTCASTKTCPEQDCGATGLSIIFSHVAKVYWVLGTKSCTLWEVVSLSYDKFSPTVFTSNTLKLHLKMCEIQLFQSWLSSVLKGLHGPKFYFTV